MLNEYHDVDWNAKVEELKKENPRFSELCDGIDDLKLLINPEYRLWLKSMAWSSCKLQEHLYRVK